MKNHKTEWILYEILSMDWTAILVPPEDPYGLAKRVVEELTINHSNENEDIVSCLTDPPKIKYSQHLSICEFSSLEFIIHRLPDCIKKLLSVVEKIVIDADTIIARGDCIFNIVASAKLTWDKKIKKKHKLDIIVLNHTETTIMDFIRIFSHLQWMREDILFQPHKSNKNSSIYQTTLTIDDVKIYLKIILCADYDALQRIVKNQVYVCELECVVINNRKVCIMTIEDPVTIKRQIENIFAREVFNLSEQGYNAIYYEDSQSIDGYLMRSLFARILNLIDLGFLFDIPRSSQVLKYINYMAISIQVATSRCSICKHRIVMGVHQIRVTNEYIDVVCSICSSIPSESRNSIIYPSLVLDEAHII